MQKSELAKPTGYKYPKCTTCSHSASMLFSRALHTFLCRSVVTVQLSLASGQGTFVKL